MAVLGIVSLFFIKLKIVIRTYNQLLRFLYRLNHHQISVMIDKLCTKSFHIARFSVKLVNYRKNLRRIIIIYIVNHFKKMSFTCIEILKNMRKQEMQIKMIQIANTTPNSSAIAEKTKSVFTTGILSGIP